MQPRIVVLPRRCVGHQFSYSRRTTLISTECLAHASRLNRNSVPFVRFVSNSQTSTSRKSKRLSELRSLIQEYNDAYYSKGKPLVTDREYDKLFEELQQLEAAVEQAAPSDSPTQTVGSLTQTGDKKLLEHAQPMLSLANSYDEEEVRRFDARVQKALNDASQRGVEYVTELKYDGVAVNLQYEGGKLVHAISRGNGKLGEDITDKIKALANSVPLCVTSEVARTMDKFEVRGELIMSKADFERLNTGQKDGGEREFSNPRNLVAGILNRKTVPSLGSSKKPLDLICYSLLPATDDSVLPFNQWGRLQVLNQLGFQTDGKAALLGNVGEVLQFLTKWDNSPEREQFPYAIDGVVIKVNGLREQMLLGTTTRAPKWAIAFKFGAAKAITTLRDITYQVGRTGKVTPVAELSPVQLLGTVVSRATLHNIEYLNKMGIRIGGEVMVEKAGDVIPKVTAVKENTSNCSARSVHEISVCPCGLNEPLVRRGIDLFCERKDCPEKLTASIAHFASRDAIDINGLGESTVKTLVSSGLLKGLPDIYDLPARKPELVKLPGWGEKKADNLINAVLNSSHKDFGSFLFAVGIPHMGKNAARLLADRYLTVAALVSTSEEELKGIQGFGDVLSHSVHTFLQDPKSRDMLLRLEKAIKPKPAARPHLGPKRKATDGQEPEPEPTDQPQNERAKSGRHQSTMTIMFTGTLNSMGRREAAERASDDLGALVRSALTKDTSVLVCGDKPSQAKLRKARELGVRLMSEQEFLALLDGHHRDASETTQQQQEEDEEKEE